MKYMYISILLLAGCASAPEVLQGPNGEQLFSTTCKRLNDCYSSASAQCPAGYMVVDRSLRMVKDYDGNPFSKTDFIFKCK